MKSIWDNMVIPLLMALGGVLCWIFGGWDSLLTVLVFAVIADYITGLTAAYFEKGLSSKIALKGFFKKLLLFLVVGFAVRLDTVLSGGQPVFRTIVILYYVSVEGLSVTENLARCGVPFPAKIKEALLALKMKTEPPDASNTEPTDPINDTEIPKEE